MRDSSFWDFMIEGGDELLNTEICSHCGEVIYLDQEFEWLDGTKKIAKCPKCGEGVQIEV